MTPNNTPWTAYERNRGKLFMLLSFAVLFGITLLSGCYYSSPALDLVGNETHVVDTVKVTDGAFADSAMLAATDTTSTWNKQGRSYIDTLGFDGIGMFGLRYDSAQFDTIRHYFQTLSREVDSFTHRVFALPAAGYHADSSRRKAGH